MEYFVPIKQHDMASFSYEEYEISKLENVRRIGTTKNLKRYKNGGYLTDGYWKDPENKRKIFYKYVEDQLKYDMNNILKVNCVSKRNISELQLIPHRYKQIITKICSRDLKLTKINLPFGISKYDQYNTISYNTLKKIPYGVLYSCKGFMKE